MKKSKTKTSIVKSKEVEELKNQLARALADYDNLRKRTEEERINLIRYASRGLIQELLPVLDTFESAQKHLKDSGLAIAIGEFINVLRDEGLAVINPSVGDEFDEREMEAVEVVVGPKDNKVSEVVLAGWRYIDGMVIRHAKVKVYKHSLSEQKHSLASETGKKES